jgi:hypothetical protein
MKGFMSFFFAILLGIAAICGANSVQAAASSSLGIKYHASLQITSSPPQHNLRQSTGHESLNSSSNNDHVYRQLEYYDFTNITTEQLGAAEVGFLVAIVVIVVFLLLLCCCCCGRRGGGCSVCDILAAICIWEMCCDQRDPTDFCLV